MAGRPRTSRNGSSIDEALRQLLQTQALAQMQIARADERIARAEERSEVLRQETRETFLRLMRDIAELRLMLERLPEAVREKIGFGAARA